MGEQTYLSELPELTIPSNSAVPVVTAVSIRNYKSIARCTVQLGPLQFVVGRNGSGKSNFLDALRFVSDSLDFSLEQALRDRGGIDSVRRIARGHPRNFAIGVNLYLTQLKARATYSFEISSRPNGGFVVKRESCIVRGADGPSFFEIQEGELLRSSVTIPALLEPDRLGLATISGIPPFRAVYDTLRRMRFYSLNPERMRDLQDPDPGKNLSRDGRNLAAVVRELAKAQGGEALAEVQEHLKRVVPGVVSVDHRGIGHKETLEFRQIVAGDDNPWRFMAHSMSDGTLRSVGILAATLGARFGSEPVTLVGLEEPETALHPSAADVLTEVLLLASKRVQIIVTTHSPEILDHKGIRDYHLLPCAIIGGETVVTRVGEVTKSLLREHLSSAGELLTQGTLEPEAAEAAYARRQLELFSESE